MKENTVYTPLGGGCIVVLESEIKKTEVMTRDNGYPEMKPNVYW